MSAQHPNRVALEAVCRRFQLHILYAFGSRGREALGWLHGSALLPFERERQRRILEGSR